MVGVYSERAQVECGMCGSERNACTDCKLLVSKLEGQTIGQRARVQDGQSDVELRIAARAGLYSRALTTFGIHFPQAVHDQPSLRYKPTALDDRPSLTDARHQTRECSHHLPIARPLSTTLTQ